MPESAKESATGLLEGSDIGLGPGDRAFEPHYSDQNPSEINDFRGIFLILCILRRRILKIKKAIESIIILIIGR